MSSRRRHRLELAVIAIVLTISARVAAGDPTVRHVLAPAVCSTEKTPRFDLPPGYFYDETTSQVLDAEIRRLQDAETRLTAENKSLRASASGLPISWGVAVAVASAIGVGFAIGHYSR